MMLAYERAEEWEVIGHLLTHQLSFSFISLQMVGGGLIPLILLGIVVLMDRYMDDRIRNTLTMVASLLLLLQVLSMRWNVVIGGQMFSKSMTRLPRDLRARDVRKGGHPRRGRDPLHTVRASRDLRKGPADLQAPGIVTPAEPHDHSETEKDFSEQQPIDERHVSPRQRRLELEE